MRFLLDTHILLWVLEADPKLSIKASELIRSTANEVFVSTSSLVEIAIKIKVGKLDTQRTPTEITQEMVRVLAMQLLPILPRHLDAYQSIPLYEDHRDPFDRLLIAIALAENLTIISDDSKFERYSSIIDLVQ
ncbi:type II toxin-antitoxin system VapC family toxin [Spirosoma endophyticum]|uniref:PIN domain nuclease, a component of toxin-antitoxin system (PIN domain) n=1 Tax=Spirosoma endophyticum TaxID=662367 RepID=A0A1I1I1P1_9BACT|nr:type II toxin-antitoxin system VapC family toxin [Spirosoma endophyticum]SFC30114.1 PIN domain nuclease, a component of toxin-antitoxin system (PIN domain) [Spirosoma endophyticum]